MREGTFTASISERNRGSQLGIRLPQLVGEGSDDETSELIDGLVNQARELRDNATDNFLQWFVEEQVEEEVSADRIVQQLKLVGKDPAGLFILDRELAKRGATP